VVGYGGNAQNSSEAFRWTEIDGMQSVQDLLAAEGIDLGGWTLRRATGVSADGTTIVGWGLNPDGKSEGWVATLPLP
jgi:hypothetical protein